MQAGPGCAPSSAGRVMSRLWLFHPPRLVKQFEPQPELDAQNTLRNPLGSCRDLRLVQPSCWRAQPTAAVDRSADDLIHTGPLQCLLSQRLLLSRVQFTKPSALPSGVGNSWFASVRDRSGRALFRLICVLERGIAFASPADGPPGRQSVSTIAPWSPLLL